MREYLVSLDRMYHGPLDLLLHLVREKEVEINRISLANLAEDYERHIAALENLDVNEIGEYLVLAATLILIKSRSLLPASEIDIEEDLGPDDELIQQLIAYKRFREAGEEFHLLEGIRDRQFERGYYDETETVEEVVIEELSPWDLLAAFTRALRSGEIYTPHTVGGHDRPLRDYIVDVLEYFQETGAAASFQALLSKFATDRIAVVGTFFAILELARQGIIVVGQCKAFSDIELRLIADDLEQARERVLFALEVHDQHGADLQGTDTRPVSIESESQSDSNEVFEGNEHNGR